MAAAKAKTEQDENLFKGSLPPSVYTVEGEAVVGTFVRLAKGIPHDEYGISPVVVFTYESGKFADRAGTIEDGVVGKEYGWYLISEVARNEFKRVLPKTGERIAFRDDGKAPSGSRLDAKGNPVEYHVIRFSCPDRPIETTEFDVNDL